MNVVRALTTLVLAVAGISAAQEMSGVPTPLSQLLAEASASNSEILAAKHNWEAATFAPRQVTALPDPTVTVQQFSVGSPKPFAGYTNSDFAYIGIGVSQELPYRGKLRLRGIAAEREADVRRTEIGATEVSVADAVKADYLKLAYLQSTLGILKENEQVLDLLIQNVTLHYQVGEGMQQDVLQSQIERTKLVREITMHHQQAAVLEAQLKGLLHRDQSSPDIVTEASIESPLRLTAAELQDAAKTNNPQLRTDASSVLKEDARLASAKRDGKPDFGLGYMYENTDRKFRDYYMLTLSARFPRKQRVNAEIGEAAAMAAQSRATFDAHLQQKLSEVQQTYITATSDAEILKEYREGLIPQTDAAYRATLSAYEDNREQFAHVLASVTSLLNLKLEYAETLEEHEIALAHLESLTGATLR
jgi:outer membrane protein TolC